MPNVPSTRGTVMRAQSVGRLNVRLPSPGSSGLQDIGRGLQKAGAAVDKFQAEQERKEEQAAAEALRTRNTQDKNNVRRATSDMNTEIDEFTANAEADPNTDPITYSEGLDGIVESHGEGLDVGDPLAKEEWIKNAAVAKRRQNARFRVGHQKRVQQEEVASKAAAVENLSVRIANDHARLSDAGGNTAEWIGEHVNDMTLTLNDATEDMSEEEAELFTRGFIAKTVSKLVANMVSDLETSPDVETDVASIKTAIDSFSDLSDADKSTLQKHVDSQVASMKRTQALAERNAQNQKKALIAQEAGKLTTQVERDVYFDQQERNDPGNKPFFKKLRAGFKIETSPTTKREVDLIVDDVRLQDDEKLARVEALRQQGLISTQDYGAANDDIQKALKGQPAETLRMMNEYLDSPFDGLDRKALDSSLGKKAKEQDHLISVWMKEMLREFPNKTFDELKKVLGASLNATNSDKALMALRESLIPFTGLSAHLEKLPELGDDKAALGFALKEVKRVKERSDVRERSETTTPTLDPSKLSNEEFFERMKRAFAN